MSDPVDVQAERLRELAARLESMASSSVPGSASASMLLGAARALRESSALLAGQAEQIERLERQNHDLDFRLEAEKSSHRTDNRELVRQRDNLRYALREIAEVSDDRADDPLYTRDMAREALRAAAVGGDNSAYGEQVWERCYGIRYDRASGGGGLNG